MIRKIVAAWGLFIGVSIAVVVILMMGTILAMSVGLVSKDAGFPIGAQVGQVWAVLLVVAVMATFVSLLFLGCRWCWRQLLGTGPRNPPAALSQ